MTTEPYVPTVDEIRECVTSFEFAWDDAGFDRMIAKIKADALREAAESLPAPVGLKCNAECHDADRLHLRIRADGIEEEA